MRRRPRRSSDAGFTLIEMLAVVVVLAVMAAMVLPELGQPAGVTAGAAARTLVADLMYAQAQAVATGTTQYVAFTPVAAGGTGYALYDHQPFDAAATDPTTLNPYTVTFGAGPASTLAGTSVTTLTLDGASNTVLAFDAQGRPMAGTAAGAPALLAGTGVIRLSCGAAVEQVSVEADTGELTVSP